MILKKVPLRRLDGQQITLQIFLTILHMIIWAIKYHLVMKKAIYFNYFAISLYRALHFKEINIVLKWPWQSSPLKGVIFTVITLNGSKCNVTINSIKLARYVISKKVISLGGRENQIYCFVFRPKSKAVIVIFIARKCYFMNACIVLCWSKLCVIVYFLFMQN